MIDWMKWTLPTAGFFTAVVMMLAAMTVWERLSPNSPRRGILPLVTTRGDRLFIGLLGSAYIHLLWIGLSEAPVIYVLPVAALFLILTLRFA